LRCRRHTAGFPTEDLQNYKSKVHHDFHSLKLTGRSSLTDNPKILHCTGKPICLGSKPFDTTRPRPTRWLLETTLPITNEVGVVQDEVVAVVAASTTSPTPVEGEASPHPSPQKRNIYFRPPCQWWKAN